MLDRSARQRLADKLAAFMRGEIDNFEIDDALWSYDGKDASLQRLCRALWGFYDDVKRHPLSVDLTGWKTLRRCLAFLGSAGEMIPGKPRRPAELSCWPFRHATEILRARPRLQRYALPAFDPNIHSRPIRAWDIHLGSGWYWIVALIAFILVAVLF